MKFAPTFLLLSIFILGACSYFDSEPEEKPLPGERLSILDLQKELQPASTSSNITIKTPVARDNTNWPQAGGYPHHAMQNLALGDAEQLERIWSADIGQGSSNGLPLTAQPVVAAGKVFTLDTRSQVSAFHNQTGKKLWQTSVRHQTEEEPVISGGVAYSNSVLYVTSGYDEVLALNPENGEIVWRTTISAPSRGAPTIHNSRIFVTTLSNNAIALDARTGKILWEYEGVGETTGLLGSASPAADGNLVIPAFSSGDLVALRTESGSVVWDDSLANSLRLGGISGLSDIRGLPVISGNIVIAVSYGGKIVAIDKNNGNRLWQRDISSAETPWVADNTIYILSADYKLLALSRSNGDVIWMTELQKYKKPQSRKGLLTWTGPVMGGGRLLLAGTDGRIAEFNPQNGSKLAEWSTKKTIRISPVIAGGTLFLLAEDGSLLAYR